MSFPLSHHTPSRDGKFPAERNPMRIYTITEPSGRKTAIMAKSRTEAINKFIAQTGVPLDFFKKNCSIK